MASKQKNPVISEDKPVPRGELELLDIEQLINVDDLPDSNNSFM